MILDELESKQARLLSMLYDWQKPPPYAANLIEEETKYKKKSFTSKKPRNCQSE